MRRNSLFGVAAVVLMGGVAACGRPATPELAPSAAAVPLTTAVVVESATPRAHAVAGSDGSTHVEYDLVVTNAFTADVTLTGLVVQDDGGRELRRLEGDDLRATTLKLFRRRSHADRPALLPAVAVIVDVVPSEGQGKHAPRRPEPAHVCPPGRRAGSHDHRRDDRARTAHRGRSQARCRSLPTPERGRMAELQRVLPGVDGAPIRAVAEQRHLPGVRDVRRRLGAGPRRPVCDGDGTHLTDHYAYGADVHAATKGEVVGVRSDMAEAPVNQSMTGNPTVKEPRDYAGNHVAVRSAADRYAVDAHLQTGPPGCGWATRSRQVTSSASWATAETVPPRTCTSPFRRAGRLDRRQLPVRHRRLPAHRDRDVLADGPSDRPDRLSAAEDAPPRHHHRDLRAQGPAAAAAARPPRSAHTEGRRERVRRSRGSSVSSRRR